MCLLICQAFCLFVLLSNSFQLQSIQSMHLYRKKKAMYSTGPNEQHPHWRFSKSIPKQGLQAAGILQANKTL
jgi:hypothetical protein